MLLHGSDNEAVPSATPQLAKKEAEQGLFKRKIRITQKGKNAVNKFSMNSPGK